MLTVILKEFEEVETVTFHYNQRHSQEIEVAKSIAEKLGVKNHLLDMSLLNQLAPNALTRNDIEIEVKDGELPSTFVPVPQFGILILCVYPGLPNWRAPHYYRSLRDRLQRLS